MTPKSKTSDPGIKIYRYYSRHLRAYIRFVLSDTKDLGKAVVKELGLNDSPNLVFEEAAGLSFKANTKDNITFYFIKLKREWIPDTDCISVLSHEAVHMAMSILKDRGMCTKITEGNDEILAYTVGEIVEAFMEKYFDDREKTLFPDLKPLK